MQLTNHSRKTSISSKIAQTDLRKTHGQYFQTNKSLKESPQSSSYFWFRKTQHHVSNRCKTYEQSEEKQTNRRNYNIIKIEDCFNNPYFTKFKQLWKIKNINLQSALYLVKTCVKQCAKNHSKHGNSYFSIKNCYLNQQNKLLFNQLCSSKLKSPYTAISDESVIVRDIIQSIHKICDAKCFDDFYSYYKRISLRTKCDFKYALSLIKSYCMCSKITIPSRVQLQLSTKTSNKIVKQNPHLRSEQKMPNFKQSNLKVQKKKSLQRVERRQSMYKKLFQSIPKNVKHQSQKIQNRREDRKNSLQSISIQHQYNLALIPKSEELVQRRNSQIKTSTVSTNFKSSHHPGDILQMSNTNLKSQNSDIKNNDLFMTRRTNEIKQHFTFLPKDLDQVQSLGQSSDYEQDTMPSRKYQTPKDHHQQNIKIQNQLRILTINNWTKKIQDLLSEQTDLKQSFTQQALQTKQNRTKIPDPQYLRKMVRVTAQSYINIPSQFHLRQF